MAWTESARPRDDEDDAAGGADEDVVEQVRGELDRIEESAGEEAHLQHHRHGRVEAAAGPLDEVERLQGRPERRFEQDVDGDEADDVGREIEPAADVRRCEVGDDGDGDVPAIERDVAGRV